MDNAQLSHKTKLDDSQSWASFSIHRNLSRPWPSQSDCNYKKNGNTERYRKYFYFLAVGALTLSPTHTLAADVGGVSATAAPVANSSGSVTNQAIQVLQGPYITNTYGNGIQCQGPTLNITPYLTRTGSFQKPYEPYYNDPVYDTSDLNEDGLLDNPGKVLYEIPVRTGQKSNYSWNAGLSATLSIPLDGGLQARCKSAADTQIELQRQVLANRRLDFEIARLKNCGELAKAGITFHPKSPFFKVCADVIVRQPQNTVRPHKHSISSGSVSTPEERGYAPSEQQSSAIQIPVLPVSQKVQQLSSSPSLPQALSTSGLNQMPVLQVKPKWSQPVQ
jgi:hypothetical protein